MKKNLLLSLFAIGITTAVISTPIYANSNMERLYNPNSGEHFYTANTNEVQALKKVGWKDEGVGWVSPDDGVPVYRLYNPNAGDHHYTLNTAEKDSLVKAGWRYEGIGWYSDGGIPIYREYNPNAKSGAHNYTTSKPENDKLVQSGWRAEGIGWYGMGGGWTKPQTYNQIRKNNKISGYGKLEGVRTYGWRYRRPDIGSYVLIVPKDGSAYDYQFDSKFYYLLMTISDEDSQKYHIYSTTVANMDGSYSINHVAAGEYKMIVYSNAYWGDVPSTTKKWIQDCFAPYINAESAYRIGQVDYAADVYDITIRPNETTVQNN